MGMSIEVTKCKRRFTDLKRARIERILVGCEGLANRESLARIRNAGENMAEGARFELADPLRGLRFSRPARSAAPSPLLQVY